MNNEGVGDRMSGCLAPQQSRQQNPGMAIMLYFATVNRNSDHRQNLARCKRNLSSS
jgi:hypothetical protein